MQMRSDKLDDLSAATCTCGLKVEGLKVTRLSDEDVGMG